MIYLAIGDDYLSYSVMPDSQNILHNHPSHWTFEEFKTYLLIFASYADLEFSEDEKCAILQAIDRKTFDSVQQFYLNLGEYERLNFILQAKPTFYPCADKKKEIITLITSQFEVDGSVSKLERGLLDFLIRLL